MNRYSMDLLWCRCYNILLSSYLSTKSDFKTILLPVIIFAGVSSETINPIRFTRTIIWVWCHLLQFCLSNQSISPEEDALNKPWRPIPAGRLSIRDAKTLRWALLPFCLLLSQHYEVFWAGAMLSIGIFLNNEGHLDTHWLTRNVMNSLGYYAFEVGACRTALGLHGSQALDRRTLSAVIYNSLIILTTIHAQDFADEPGDRMQNRKTLPIVAPLWSRISMLYNVLFWSMFLCRHFSLNSVESLFLSGLGLFVGIRFIVFNTTKADKTSYMIYNLWLSIAQVGLLRQKTSPIQPCPGR